MALIDDLRLPDSRVLDESFYVLMESHVAYLRSHANTQTVSVTGQQAEKYTGDLNGLLDILAIDKKYQYLITRVNGLKCSTAYDGKTTEIRIPEFSQMARFMTIHDSIET